MAAIQRSERLRQPSCFNWEKAVKYGAALVTAAAVLVWTAISLIGNQPEQSAPARNRQNLPKPEPMIWFNGQNMTCDGFKASITPASLFPDVVKAYPEIADACKFPTGKVAKPVGAKGDPHSP